MCLNKMRGNNMKVYILQCDACYGYEGTVTRTIGVFSSLDRLKDHVEDTYKIKKFKTSNTTSIGDDRYLYVEHCYLDDTLANTPKTKSAKDDEDPFTTGNCINNVFANLLSKKE